RVLSLRALRQVLSDRRNPRGDAGGLMTPRHAAIAWTLAGNTIYAGCQWAMLVVIAKLGSSEAVGAFALAFAVTAPVVMLSSLQLRVVQATDARGQFEFGHYLALRLVTIAVAWPACVTAGCFGG